MPESSSRVSETRPVHSLVEQRETNDYFQSNNEVKNSVSVGAGHYGDESKIPENEKFETSEKRSISSKVDLDPVHAKVKREDDDLTRESWMERDTGRFIGDLMESQESYFVTGSSYEGSWDALGMAGVGRYVMPHGTIYEGEMRDGMFHGQGSLYWPNNQRLDVVHHRGELKEYRYTFHDGLVYEENNWNYCKFPDRRFYESVKKGLRPGGRTLKTANQPTKVLPSGCYDTGDGFFDPKTYCLTSFDDSKKVRIPSKDEREWIVKNCRKSWTEPTGYRPDLNENWSDDPPELPYNLPMSQDSPDHRWKRLTTVSRDRDFLRGQSEKDHDESSASPEICMCGEYVIIGEPCHCVHVSGSSDPREYENMQRSFNDVESGEYHEDHGVKEVFLESSEDSSIKETRNYSRLRSFSRVRLNENYVTKNINKFEYPREIPRIIVTHASSTSEEYSKDSIDGESLKKSRHKRKPSKDVKILQSSEKTRTGQREHNESLKKSTNEVIMQENTTKNDDKVRERSENLRQAEILQRDKEKERKNGETKDFIKDKEQEKFDEETEIFETFVEKSNKENIEQFEGLVRKQNPQKSDEISHEEKNYRSEEMMKEKILEKSVEESGKQNVVLPKDTYEEILNKNAEELSNESSTIEKKIDYTTDSIPREKVDGLIKPETTNGRRSKTKHLSKDASVEYHDHKSHETESIVKKSQTDLSDDRDNENTDKIFENSTYAYRIELDDKIIAKNLMNQKKFKENVVINLDETAKDKLKRDSKLSAEIKIEMSGANIMKKSRTEREFRLEFVQIDKSMRESGKKFETTNAYSISKTRPEENVISCEFVKEFPEIPEVIHVEEIPLVSNFVADEKSTSPVITERWGTMESSKFFIDDLAKLDKVHPSLASLVSTKHKLSKEKEIIEIYSKLPSKEKPKILPMNTNVWRLSGVNPDYGPKTKIEDLLLHPALTAPRSEKIEYVRKPCDFGFSEPTLQEVRTIASRNRKEYPSKYPAKLIQSSAHRNLKEKK